MARIGEHVTGVITAVDPTRGAVTLRAGDEIPDGVAVAGSLTADGVEVAGPVAPSPVPGPVSASARTPRLPPRSQSAVTSWDPHEHTVAQVETFLSAHPGEFDRVLAAEQAGGAPRKAVMAMKRPEG